jgi:endonuclease G
LIYCDSQNDFFLDSHGIATPDYFWRILKVEDNVISWYIYFVYYRLIPNLNNLGELTDYMVSIDEIEVLLNDGLGPINIPNSLKKDIAEFSWDCSDRMSFVMKSKKLSRKRKKESNGQNNSTN